MHTQFAQLTSKNLLKAKGASGKELKHAFGQRITLTRSRRTRTVVMPRERTLFKRATTT